LLHSVRWSAIQPRRVFEVLKGNETGGVAILWDENGYDGCFGIALGVGSAVFDLVCRF
jgi:hypothetical protein